MTAGGTADRSPRPSNPTGVLWAMKQLEGRQGLSAEARQLLINLAGHANASGIASASQGDLAAQTRITDRSVRRHLGKMEEMGLLQVEVQGGRRGSHIIPSTYRLSGWDTANPQPDSSVSQPDRLAMSQPDSGVRLGPQPDSKTPQPDRQITPQPNSRSPVGRPFLGRLSRKIQGTKWGGLVRARARGTGDSLSAVVPVDPSSGLSAVLGVRSTGANSLREESTGVRLRKNNKSSPPQESGGRWRSRAVAFGSSPTR